MTTWVLLRGLTREAGHWARLPELLQRRFPGSRILTLDFPGNGVHHRLRSPTRIAAMTDFCIERLDASGAKAPFGLIAMSMGAMVAIDWASRAPGAIAGCVLINTSMRPFDPWYRRLRPRNLPALCRLALPGSDQARERTVLRMTSRNRDAAQAVLDDWAALRRTHPVARFDALRQLRAAARFVAPSEVPAVPMLVLGSVEDGLVDVRCSIGLARRWRTALALHPAAGHDLPLDDPAWLADQVAAWAAGQVLDPSDRMLGETNAPFGRRLGARNLRPRSA